MRIRKAINLICALVLVCTLSVSAFADGTTTITTEILSAEVTVTAGEHGGYSVDGKAYTGSHTFHVRQDKTFTLNYLPDDGYTYDTPVISGALGGVYLGYTSLSLVPGNAVVTVEFNFKKGTMPTPQADTPAEQSGKALTFPLSLGKGLLQVSGSLKNKILTVKDVDDEALHGILYAEDAPSTLIVDLTASDAAGDISGFVVPLNMIADIARAANDPASAIVGMRVLLTDGDMSFDCAALQAIVDQASGTDMEFYLDDVGSDGLNSAQSKTAKKLDLDILSAYELYIASGGTRITSFNGGCVRVTVDSGEAKACAVYYAAEDGPFSRLPSATRDGSTAWLCFHFSTYVLTEADPAASFADVPEGTYYTESVAWAVQNGITTGISETCFDPDSVCTRAQMVTFLWRSAGCPEPKSGSTAFTDLAAGSYYEDAVLWAVENGITNGTGKTTFSPNAPVTRAQAVTFLYRFLRVRAGDGTLPFKDVPSNAYYHDPVLWAYESGVTTGTSKTAFSPDAPCTRACIVTFLFRSY